MSSASASLSSFLVVIMFDSMRMTLAEFWPPKPLWTVNDVPDLEGKVAIVTGGNTGIGKVICKYLLLHNARVYILSRSSEKAQAAIHDLQEETGKEARFVRCDLADLKSVRTAATEFLSKESRLDILFNSAGVMIPPIQEITAQGYDLQFGTNVLGHFYLTKLLLPILLSSAKTSRDRTVRVVNTSSNGHYLYTPKIGIDYDLLKDGPVRRKKGSPMTLYGISKYGNVVFAKELARRYGAQGIVSTSLHPGTIRTGISQHMSKLLLKVGDFIFHDVDPYGAVTALYAGTAKETVNMNGAYFIPFARVGEARPDTNDLEVGRRLWEYLENQTRDM